MKNIGDDIGNDIHNNILELTRDNINTNISNALKINIINSFNNIWADIGANIEDNVHIQDGKGNILPIETIKARIKQRICNHHWIKMGLTYACPKCYKVKND
jgi:Zn finger protein HypA/HybF involved in hydrogenase expression